MRPGCPLVANAIVFASLSALATGGCRGGSTTQATHEAPPPIVDAAIPDATVSAADAGPQPTHVENEPPHDSLYGGEFRIKVSLAKAHRRHRRARAFSSGVRHAHDL